ncbi:hypothetical protein [Cellulomonas sp. PhB150]|uniref:hypothetical protein n=1 Tax=Cellulomonas sp. PhB150 TaxID=2485188 RepID=UPI000FAE40AE|nr:hypothetical protein [Cellulomonas sp. PhB150]ROS23057.1 hypothetical protein EDF34_3233 [Cellulomonas sp. PhB150]
MTADAPRRLGSPAGLIGVVVLVAGLSGLAACAAPASDDAADAEPDNWVVVTFGDTEHEFDTGAMDSLLSTEVRADDALQAAGAGWIDGNEVGDHQYDLYFAGSDREEMWALLEPVFAAAPIRWSRVELRDGLDDPAAIVVTP